MPRLLPFCVQAYAHLMRPDQRDRLSYEEVGSVLRHLVEIAGSRAQARSYFDQMRELLRDFSAGNCPMAHDVAIAGLEPTERRPNLACDA